MEEEVVWGSGDLWEGEGSRRVVEREGQAFGEMGERERRKKTRRVGEEGEG